MQKLIHERIKTTVKNLYKKLFDTSVKNVHNSMIDIILCLRSYCMIENLQDIKKTLHKFTF